MICDKKGYVLKGGVLNKNCEPKEKKNRFSFVLIQ